LPHPGTFSVLLSYSAFIDEMRNDILKGPLNRFENYKLFDNNSSCIESYIFRSQNALKLTYVNAQFQKLSGVRPQDPNIGKEGRIKTLRQNPGY